MLTREKNLENSFHTSPAHLAQIIRVPAPVQLMQCAPASQQRATSPQTVAPKVFQTRNAHRSRYKNLPLCQTVPHSASNSRTQDRRDKVACNARREWGRVRGFHLRFFGAADSQSPSPSLISILRRAYKHFDEVIMQRVIQLPLKAPFEVGMVEVARMKIEVIRMNRNRCVFELNDDFHALALGASRKIHQRCLFKAN